jgi:hypothetical protein
MNASSASSAATQPASAAQSTAAPASSASLDVLQGLVQSIELLVGLVPPEALSTVGRHVVLLGEHARAAESGDSPLRPLRLPYTFGEGVQPAAGGVSRRRWSQRSGSGVAAGITFYGVSISPVGTPPYTTDNRPHAATRRYKMVRVVVAP